MLPDSESGSQQTLLFALHIHCLEDTEVSSGRATLEGESSLQVAAVLYSMGDSTGDPELELPISASLSSLPDRCCVTYSRFIVVLSHKKMWLNLFHAKSMANTA